jgi:hypothetical protein
MMEATLFNSFMGTTGCLAMAATMRSGDKAGGDSVSGGEGNDRLNGGGDTTGGAGDPYLDGSWGSNDVLDGGPDTDTCREGENNSNCEQ